MNETKNPEGYTDLTAYTAIKNLKEDSGVEIYEGDIFNIETGSGTKQVMVLSVHENYVSTLGLFESKQNECCVKVISNQVMYADAGKLGFAFKDKLIEFVKAVPQSELEDVKAEVAKALSLTVPKLEIKPRSTDTERIKIETERDIYKNLYEGMLTRMIG